MEFFGNKVNVEENYQIVGLNEVLETNDDIKMLVTRDVHSCAVVLAVAEEITKMAHIETEDIEKFKEGLHNIKEMVENTEKMQELQLFVGPHTSLERTQDLCQSLGICQPYTTFIDNFKTGSIGYNTVTKKYYGLDSDGNFYEYILGMQNKQRDPLVTYFSDSIEETEKSK